MSRKTRTYLSLLDRCLLARAYDKGVPCDELALQYGVSGSAVSAIAIRLGAVPRRKDFAQANWGIWGEYQTILKLIKEHGNEEPAPITLQLAALYARVQASETTKAQEPKPVSVPKEVDIKPATARDRLVDALSTYAEEEMMDIIKDAVKLRMKMRWGIE